MEDPSRTQTSTHVSLNAMWRVVFCFIAVITTAVAVVLVLSALWTGNRWVVLEGYFPRHLMRYPSDLNASTFGHAAPGARVLYGPSGFCMEVDDGGDRCHYYKFLSDDGTAKRISSCGRNPTWRFLIVYTSEIISAVVCSVAVITSVLILFGAGKNEPAQSSTKRARFLLVCSIGLGAHVLSVALLGLSVFLFFHTVDRWLGCGASFCTDMALDYAHLALSEAAVSPTDFRCGYAFSFYGCLAAFVLFVVLLPFSIYIWVWCSRWTRSEAAARDVDLLEPCSVAQCVLLEEWQRIALHTEEAKARFCAFGLIGFEWYAMKKCAIKSAKLCAFHLALLHSYYRPLMESEGANGIAAEQPESDTNAPREVSPLSDVCVSDKTPSRQVSPTAAASSSHDHHHQADAERRRSPPRQHDEEWLQRLVHQQLGRIKARAMRDSFTGQPYRSATVPESVSQSHLDPSRGDFSRFDLSTLPPMSSSLSPTAAQIAEQYSPCETKREPEDFGDDDDDDDDDRMETYSIPVSVPGHKECWLRGLVRRQLGQVKARARRDESLSPIIDSASRLSVASPRKAMDIQLESIIRMDLSLASESLARSPPRSHVEVPSKNEAKFKSPQRSPPPPP